MCDGFQMQQGVIVLHKFEHLYLAFVLRMVDNIQVYCIIY